MHDLYDILGVPHTATQEQIRSAYRSRMKRVHPDVEGGDEEAAKKLTAAYNILSDPAKRSEYDRGRTALLCPYCQADLREMTDVDQPLYQHLYEAVINSCAVCGRQPTATFNFRSNSGFVFARRVFEFDGKLCEVCAQGMYREFQTRNITRGPWGLISFFASIGYLFHNSTEYKKAQRLKAPTPSDPAFDNGLRGRSVFSRPTVWLSLSIIVLVAFNVLSDLDTSRDQVETAVGIGDRPATSSEDRGTQSRETTQSLAALDWSVGNCA